MASSSKTDDKKSSKAPTYEEIFNKFQSLRSEQRNMANKLSEFKMDFNEHKMVIETLKSVNADRKCFRMIGGVLCERTVGDVLPALENHRDQLAKVIDAVSEQVTKKGVEINEFKEKHGIKIRGQEDFPDNETNKENTSASASKDSSAATASSSSSTTTRGNVLVENSI